MQEPIFGTSVYSVYPISIRNVSITNEGVLKYYDSGLGWGRAGGVSPKMLQCLNFTSPVNLQRDLWTSRCVCVWERGDYCPLPLIYSCFRTCIRPSYVTIKRYLGPSVTVWMKNLEFHFLSEWVIIDYWHFLVESKFFHYNLLVYVVFVSKMFFLFVSMCHLIICL